MKESCDYCGSRAKAWQGDAAWCLSDACNIRHDRATYEPRFYARMDPTPLQQFGGMLMYGIFRPITAVIPAIWLCESGTFRESLAVWAYGNCYWAGERWAGVA